MILLTHLLAGKWQWWWLIPDRLKFDQVVYAYGFGITTLLCWQALSARVLDHLGKPLEPTPGLMILCAAGGMGFGALNEVIEFFATLALPKTNVGGYVNTGWDLVANLIRLGVQIAALEDHVDALLLHHEVRKRISTN